VVLVHKGAGYEGRFTLVEPDGRSTTKTLDAPDCDGLVDALSLVAALALEPGAQGEADERGSQLQSPAGGPSPNIPAPNASASRASPHQVPPSPPPAIPLVDHAGSGSTTRFGETSSRWGLELGGRVGVGVAPEATFGADVGFYWAGVAVGPLDMAFGLAISANFAPNVHPVGGTASFAWMTLHPTACPFGVSAEPTLAIRACASGDFGLLTASGQDTVSPVTSVRPWAAVGGSCRLEILPRARLPVHAEVGVEAPLRRDRYAFGPNDFFVVPIAIVTGTLSLAIPFR
jgi:hypothetical protein